MKRLMLVAICLQALDLITAFYFLQIGLLEANPIVKLAIDALGVYPGILTVKVAGALLIYAGSLTNKAQLLKGVNWGFAFILLNNSICIVVQVCKYGAF
jgi:hypothetical protein